MSDPLLDRVPALRAALDATTNILNETLIKAENALAALHLGVIAEVQMECPRDGWTRYLRFTKYGNVWGLRVEEGPTNGEVTEQPLKNCSREIRLMAVDLLPKLLEAMIASSKAETQRVKSQTEAVERFIKTTNDGEGK